MLHNTNNLPETIKAISATVASELRPQGKRNYEEWENYAIEVTMETNKRLADILNAQDAKAALYDKMGEYLSVDDDSNYPYIEGALRRALIKNPDRLIDNVEYLPYNGLSDDDIECIPVWDKVQLTFSVKEFCDLVGIKVTVDSPAHIVPAPARSTSDTVALLSKAEAFIAGFEDDPDQDGVTDLLDELRAAIAGEAPDDGIYKYMDCLLYHVPKHDFITGNSELITIPYSEGCWIFVPDNYKEMVASLHTALLLIIEKAHKLGCQWIKLDADGFEHDDLPTYSW